MNLRVHRDSLVRRPSRPAIPYVVLLAGLIATAAIAFYSTRLGRARDVIRFDSATEQVQHAVSTRIDTYLALLRSASGLFAASDLVTLPDFSRFVQRLDLRARYPGIHGIGFSRRILPAELPSVVKSMRGQGVSDFRVWPSYPRPVYHSIVYLEPLDRRNHVAIGYDMFTEPTRRAAMEEAAKKGGAAASGRVTLVQEIDEEKQAGFLIYVPVYSTGVIPDTESKRLEQLQGFVYSPFRAEDFLWTVLDSSATEGVILSVYDGKPADGHALLLTSGRAMPDGFRPTLERVRSIDVAGREWTLVLFSGPSFPLSTQSLALPWILAAGLVVSFLLFLATRSEVRAHVEAERAAAELRRSEEALRAREAELRRRVDTEREAHAEAASANRTKDEFLATLSHELRTPLNAILGWATMLKAGQLSEEQETRALDVIARNAQTQAELIEDLLDVSRIITGKLRIDTRPMLVVSAVHAALDAVRPAAAAKGVSIESGVSTDGPVLGDPDRLQQIAWNLVSNAIKFTPSGGRVCVSLGRTDGQVELRVADNGIGISPAFLPHVFDRFTQCDSSTTRNHGGMGLGLAIVRHLAELHGGTVQAESLGEGQGATFTVRLPARPTVEAPVSATAADRPRLESAYEFMGVRALVVDDDADSRDLVSNVLTRAGATTVMANSANEAMQVLGRQHVDVLLADIGMPGADGYWLIRQVRSHPSAAVRNLPALAVTAYARREDEEQARQAGFQEHVRKPVDVEALRDAVRRLVIA